MSKTHLGPRRMVAVADTTGNNTGNWTATFDPATVAVKWTEYEVYKMVVQIKTSGVIGWTVYIGVNQYEGYQSSGNASWSDTVPMIVNSGENIYFYFNQAASVNPPPVVTIWVQVDQDSARMQ